MFREDRVMDSALRTLLVSFIFGAQLAYATCPPLDEFMHLFEQDNGKKLEKSVRRQFLSSPEIRDLYKAQTDFIRSLPKNVTAQGAEYSLLQKDPSLAWIFEANNYSREWFKEKVVTNQMNPYTAMKTHWQFLSAEFEFLNDYFRRQHSQLHPKLKQWLQYNDTQLRNCIRLPQNAETLKQYWKSVNGIEGELKSLAALPDVRDFHFSFFENPENFTQDISTKVFYLEAQDTLESKISQFARTPIVVQKREYPTLSSLYPLFKNPTKTRTILKTWLSRKKFDFLNLIHGRPTIIEVKNIARHLTWKEFTEGPARALNVRKTMYTQIQELLEIRKLMGTNPRTGLPYFDIAYQLNQDIDPKIKKFFDENEITLLNKDSYRIIH